MNPIEKKKKQIFYANKKIKMQTVMKQKNLN